MCECLWCALSSCGVQLLVMCVSDGERFLPFTVAQ